MMADETETVPGLPDAVWRTVCDEERLAALYRLETLDSAVDTDFDRLTGLAATLMQAPVALVTLVDRQRQTFKSRHGLDMTGTPVNMSFCAHAIASDADVTVVEDTADDPRFAQNPLVTGEHRVRFYFGAPITIAGAKLGTLCVLDRMPRPRPSAELIDQFKSLADLAASLFILKDETRAGALARTALAREEKRRAIAIEAAGLASWVWSVRSDVVECDALLPTLYNFPPANRMRARDIFLSIDRRDVVEAEGLFRAALQDSDDYSGEYRVRGIEPARWLAARGRVIERDGNGNPLLVFGVNYDISERKSGEQRQRLLLRELNHRVQNTLATVQALATQTVRHAREPDQFLKAFSGRLQALGQAHGLLSDHEWRGIGIQDLVRREVRAFDDASRPRVIVTGEDMLLSPDQALGLGLALHELASNALKYGALSVPGGVVRLGWRVEGRHQKRRLLLSWHESGGPPVEPPQRQGFGSILIRRSMAKVLSSEVSHAFAAGGVTADISFQIEPQAD